jgi:cytochrome P450 family 135
MSLPPGPPEPPLAQTLQWSFRPAAFMERCARDYGDPFTARMGGFGEAGEAANVVFVSDPAAIKAIFTGGPELSRVFDSRRGMAPMFGPHSILLVDGAEHLRNRKLMLPPFHGERMAGYGELMREVADTELDGWPIGREIALQPRMQRITLEVILRAVFGLDAGPRRDEVRDRIETLLADVANPFAEFVLGLPERIRSLLMLKFRGKADRADEVLHREIALRRRDPRLEEREDILSLLLQARDEDGQPMDDAELRDQLIALLLAGHETTATAMSWIFDLLFHHPAVHRRLEEEQDDEYLDAVIAEAMRLYPPLPLIDRTLAVPFDVSGYTLPPGTVVAPCIYLAHRRPDVYPEPNAFRPERFLGRRPDTYSWIPFGGGIRRCVGASFASYEMRVVLRTILGRATLRGAGARPERIRRRAIVIAPQRGTRAVLHARKPVGDVGRAPQLASA